MDTKTVNFNRGIERVNTRINCNEGACEEITNLRREGNTLNSIGQRKKLDTNNVIHININITDYEIFIHPASKHKYYIVWEKAGNSPNFIKGTVALYSATTGIRIGMINSPFVIPNALPHTLTDSNLLIDNGVLVNDNNIISVSYLDNVLIVCTTTDKYYFLWQDDKQEYTKIDINIKPTITAISKPVNTDLSTLHYFTGLYDLNILTRAESCQTWYGFYKKYLERNNTGTFIGLSFIRYAIKLYDGTYINYSNVVFVNTNGDDMQSSGSSLNECPITVVTEYGTTRDDATGLRDYRARMADGYRIDGYYHISLHFTNDDINTINTLFDNSIIQSFDVFMTRPILQINIDAKENEYNIHHFILNRDDSREFRCAAPINIKAIKEQLETGTYYKIKTYDKDEFNKTITLYYNTIEFNIKASDISTLEQNETLPTPNIFHKICYYSNYNYNQKQHIYNLIYNMFGGYDFPKPPTDIILNNPTNSTNKFVDIITSINKGSNAKLYYTLTGKFNDKKFLIKKEITNPNDYISIVDSAGTTINSFNFYLPRMFIYPTINDITLGIYIIYDNNNSKAIKLYEKLYHHISSGNDINFIADYTNSSIFNSRKAISHNVESGSYNSEGDYFYYKDPNKEGYDSYFLLNKFLVDITTLKIQSINEINQIKSTNVLQLTETDNPFVYPVDENYSFSDDKNKIKAVCATVGQITETKFGLYPLYVFCQDGIYTMSVGSGNIAYSNISLLSNNCIINNNVANIGSGIIALAKNGLLLLNGRNITNISNLVKGKPELFLNSNFTKLCYSIFGDTIDNKINFSKYMANTSRISLIDILEEIKNSKMIFDEIHNELLIICNNYTYVYNTAFNIFYKRSDTYDVVNENLLATDKLKHNSNNVYLYSLDEEEGDNEECKSMVILTKHFMLGSRQFKKIERLILDMQTNKDSNLYIILFATNDCINYKIIKKYILENNQKDLQDIYLSRCLQSFKYGVLFIASRKIKYTKICNVAIEFNLRNAVAGIR